MQMIIRVKRRSKVFVFLSTGILLTAGTGYALRCGNSPVNKGDRKIEVILKCGKPVLKEKIEDEYSYVVSEEWTYNFGAHELLYFIKFRHGRVIDIEYGEHGY